MNEKRTTFCSREKFLQSLERKVAHSPTRFFSPEPPETISLSALSASVSSSASSEAASPSSAFMLLFYKTKKTPHEIALVSKNNPLGLQHLTPAALYVNRSLPLAWPHGFRLYSDFQQPLCPF